MSFFISFHSLAVAALLLLVAPLLSGCGTLHYLLQAGHGQLALINHARPISEVIKDERTPPRIQTLLQEIAPVKAFSEKIGLKPTRNYTEYVKLDRAAAVWVVSASEPFRFSSVEWNFPIVGSFPYLGWFDRNNAEAFAGELKEKGLDVDLRGASAYSTLGWFRDAILSTMIPEGQASLGNLINVVIHESVHATLYIPGQAYFNESVASFVAEQLTPNYLDQIRGPDSPEKKAYLAAGKWSATVEKRFHEAYLSLAQVYESSKSQAEKLDEKTQILAALRSELKFKREINNATLIQFKAYNSGQSDFLELFRACGSDWVRFMKVLGTLSPRSFAKAQQEDLASLLRPLTAGQLELGPTKQLP